MCHMDLSPAWCPFSSQCPAGVTMVPLLQWGSGPRHCPELLQTVGGSTSPCWLTSAWTSWLRTWRKLCSERLGAGSLLEHWNFPQEVTGWFPEVLSGPALLWCSIEQAWCCQVSFEMPLKTHKSQDANRGREHLPLLCRAEPALHKGKLLLAVKELQQ